MHGDWRERSKAPSEQPNNATILSKLFAFTITQEYSKQILAFTIAEEYSNLTPRLYKRRRRLDV
jgi:hypothetical protein